MCKSIVSCEQQQVKITHIETIYHEKKRERVPKWNRDLGEVDNTTYSFHANIRFLAIFFVPPLNIIYKIGIKISGGVLMY